jgi:hypothetical protein
VLFVVLEQSEAMNGQPLERQLLLPLACHEAGQLLGGRACRELVARGRAVTLEGGREVTPTRPGRPRCEGVVSREVGLLLAAASADTPPWLQATVRASYAVWPRSALERVWPTGRGCRGWCSFRRTGHPRVRVAEALRGRLEQAARAAGLREGADGLEVLQEVGVDLDGDGAEERLFSVAVRDLEAADYAFRFSALFLLGEGAPRLLRRRDSDAIIVRGTTDLDGDGTRELWLLLSPTGSDGIAHEIVALDGEPPAVIGRYACRPEPG